MAKSVLVILADGFEEIEAVTPIDVLRRAGLDVTVAGVGKRQIKGAHGVTVSADVTIEDYKETPDAVVLPGGMPGAANLGKSAAVQSLLKKMNAEKKNIAAICAAPAMVLAPSGLLAGRQATCYPGYENQLGPSVRFSDERVVHDGNITTSKGPGSAFEFSLELVRQLAGSAASDELARQMVVVVR